MSKEYVMYKNFDELPGELKEKFKNGAKGASFIRAKNGYVNFINQLNQQSNELIGNYIGASTKTQVKFGVCGHTVSITPHSYKGGKGCGICNGRQVQQGINDLATTHPHLAKQWHTTKNGDLTPYMVTQGSHKNIWWQCEQGHEWETMVVNRTNMRSNCPYCSNKRVLKGYNDIATTHPHFIKYFASEEDTYTHTYSSGKRVELKCPNCGYKKQMGINKLTHQGFSCDLCSDGISYPEKIMSSVLIKLNIEFTKQLSYDNGKHKYDFYLPKYNCIIETHGLQHYEWQGRGRSLKEEQENDGYKRELAIRNGILEDNYHEIDCRYSALEWCRPNIEKTLSNYIDISVLTDEDWKQADIQAQKSLKIEVCNYWKKHKEVNSELTAMQVAKVFGVSVGVVYNYLNWGNANGFCTYNAQTEKEANDRRKSTFVYIINSNGEKWFDKPMSLGELGRQTGISTSAIRSNLDKESLKYCFNSKYDPKYIGSRIVSAEVYDNQTQAS